VTRRLRSAFVLAAFVAATAASSCADGPDGPQPLLTHLGDATWLDRRALERGHAVDIEAVTVDRVTEFLKRVES